MRKKVALVLSGGVFKRLAHIGIINPIPIEHTFLVVKRIYLLL